MNRSCRKHSSEICKLHLATGGFLHYDAARSVENYSDSSSSTNTYCCKRLCSRETLDAFMHANTRARLEQIPGRISWLFAPASCSGPARIRVSESDDVSAPVNLVYSRISRKRWRASARKVLLFGTSICVRTRLQCWRLFTAKCSRALLFVDGLARKERQGKCRMGGEG